MNRSENRNKRKLSNMDPPGENMDRPGENMDTLGENMSRPEEKDAVSTLVHSLGSLVTGNASSKYL